LKGGSSFVLKCLRRLASYLLRKANTLIDQAVPLEHELLETPTQMLSRRAFAFALEVLANVMAKHPWLHESVAQTIEEDLNRMSGRLWTTHPPGVFDT
jgi:hypothetical protein